MAVFGEQGALDLQLLSGEQCVGASAGRGPTAGLGSGVTVAPRIREGRLSRALVPVCSVNVSVYGCVMCYIMLKHVPVMCLYMCVHTCICVDG